MVEAVAILVVPGLEYRRRIIVLLDQLDLHVAPVPEHHGEVYFDGLTTVANAIQFYVFKRIEWSRSKRFRPEFQRLLEIARHVGHLHDLPELSDRSRSIHSACSFGRFAHAMPRRNNS